MTPALRHRFSSGPAGTVLDLQWRPPRAPLKARLRAFARRALIGGPDPFSPGELVQQDGFDRAVDLLAQGETHAAANVFDSLGYDCQVIGAA